MWRLCLKKINTARQTKWESDFDRRKGPSPAFFLQKWKKNKINPVRKLATRVVFPNIFQSFVMFCFTILGSQVDLYFWYECQTTLQVQQKIKSRLPVEIYVNYVVIIVAG